MVFKTDNVHVTSVTNNARQVKFEQLYAHKVPYERSADRCFHNKGKFSIPQKTIIKTTRQLCI